MNRRPFSYLLTFLAVAILSSGEAYTQTNIDSLWSLLKRFQPIPDSSPVWELAGKKQAKETCISGDCINGYGISVFNDRVIDGRYQYEGWFVNAKHHGVGIVRTMAGPARVCNFENGKETGAYIMENNGLAELHHASGKVVKKIREEYGFELAVVQKHQAYSFERFTACNCLGRATHVVETEYRQPYDVIDEFKNNKGTNYKTETQRVEYPGLRNNCPKTVFVKAISYEGGFYYDRSVAVLPGATIMKRPFHSTFNPDKEGVQYIGQFELAPVSK